MDTLSSSMPESKSHYVYTLAYPDSMGGYVFYVGKGQGKRIKAHEHEAKRDKLAEGHNPYKIRIIRKIQAQNEQVTKQIVARFETHEEASLYEIASIVLMKPYGYLTNLTDGGDGVIGYVFTEEDRRKMRLAQLGKKPSPEAIEKTRQANIGRKHTSERIEKVRQTRLANGGYGHTEEARRKISEAQKGRIAYNKGKSPSEETRRKMSKSQTGLKRSPESVAKSADGIRGKKRSEEQRRNLSEAQKKRYAIHPKQGKPLSEETKHKIGEANKISHIGKKLSEETKRKMSEAAKGRVFSEQHRLHLSEAAKKREENKVYSEETRRKMSEAAKRRNRPEITRIIEEEEPQEQLI